jgi:hypothetical protein
MISLSLILSRLIRVIRGPSLFVLRLPRRSRAKAGHSDFVIESISPSAVSVPAASTTIGVPPGIRAHQLKAL